MKIDKTIYQLINEIDDIQRAERKKHEEDVVNKVNSAYEEIQKLQDKIQQKGKRAHH
jgi:hypothetical protein